MLPYHLFIYMIIYSPYITFFVSNSNPFKIIIGLEFGPEKNIRDLNKTGLIFYPSTLKDTRYFPSTYSK